MNGPNSINDKRKAEYGTMDIRLLLRLAEIDAEKISADAHRTLEGLGAHGPSAPGCSAICRYAWLHGYGRRLETEKIHWGAET